jgi:hypothetical protein
MGMCTLQHANDRLHIMLQCTNNPVPTSCSGGLAPYTCRYQAASWMLAALHCSSGTPAGNQLQCMVSDAFAVTSFLAASASANLGDSVRVLACPLSLLSITHFNSLLADGSLCCR